MKNPVSNAENWEQTPSAAIIVNDVPDAVSVVPSKRRNQMNLIQQKDNPPPTSDDPNKYLDSTLNPYEYTPYYGCPNCGANWEEEGAVFEYGHAEGGVPGKVDADGDFIQPPESAFEVCSYEANEYEPYGCTSCWECFPHPLLYGDEGQ